MINKSTVAKKLASYSTLATVVLLAGETAEGQVIYHKFPKPDTLTGTLSQRDSFLLDLNNDGIMDFNILTHEVYLFQSTIKGNYGYSVLAKIAFVQGINKGAGQALNTGYTRFVYEGRLYALATGVVIRNERSKYTFPGTRFSYKMWNRGGGAEVFSGYDEANLIWARYGETDFAGLRIKTGASSNYGWIRLNLLQDSSSVKLVVYDYAYQQLKNTPIIAGDTGFFQSPPMIKIASVDSVDCEKDSIAIQAVSIPAGATLQWYADNKKIGNPTTDTSIVLRQSGRVYAVVSLDSNSTVTNAISVQIPFLPAKPTIKQNKDSLISSQAFSYQWYLNSKPIIGFTTREILPEQTGFYQVMITDTNGCSNISDSLEIVITGIQNNSELPTLFASEKVLHVQMSNPDFIDGALNIFNELGQSVLSQPINSENFNLSLAELPSGIYFVRLEINAKQIVRKIVVQ